MSTTIFDDDFSSYTPGSSAIAGFFNPNGNGVVLALSTMTGSSEAPGFYEKFGQAYGLDNTFLVHQDSATTDTQIVWASISPLNNAGDGFAGCAIALDNANISAGTGAGWAGAFNGIVQVQFNPDYTVGLQVPNTFNTSGIFQAFQFAITESQANYLNVWQYYQVNFHFFASPQFVGTSLINYMGVVGTLAINGTAMCSGTVTTNFTLSTLATGAANVNQWRFFSGGVMKDITGYSGLPLPTFATWPHPGSPLQSLYTQSVVEVSKQYTTRAGRVTQGAIELVKHFPANQRDARVTQGVVEIILRRTPGGWTVYEA